MPSEFTYMLDQLPPDKHAIIFNNEEGGDKLGFRCMQSALNMSTGDMCADAEDTKRLWKMYLGNKRLDIYHDTTFSRLDVQAVLAKEEYWLIGINVLETVSAYHKYDAVERRQKLAEWCRGLADKHGVVMSVMQAGESAEGVKWLNQSQLYGSRTGVQGEIDVLLMIGKEHNNETQRFFHVAKNKKPTTGRMDPRLKHGKFIVAFDEERGRYNSKIAQVNRTRAAR